MKTKKRSPCENYRNPAGPHEVKPITRQGAKENTWSTLIIPSEELIDFKEALIFGLLGVLRLRGEINCFASVTGCSNDHSTGIIYQP